MGTSIHLFIARFLLFASLFFIKFKRIFFLTAMYVNTNVIKSKVFGNFMEFDWNWKLWKKVAVVKASLLVGVKSLLFVLFYFLTFFFMDNKQKYSWLISHCHYHNHHCCKSSSWVSFNANIMEEEQREEINHIEVWSLLFDNRHIHKISHRCPSNNRPLSNFPMSFNFRSLSGKQHSTQYDSMIKIYLAYLCVISLHVNTSKSIYSIK